MNRRKKIAGDMVPGNVIHPGEILHDELEARSMSQQELAVKMKMSKSEISLLLNRHRNITPMIAVLLERVLGIDAEIWMNLQIKYDIDCVRKKMRHAIETAKISPSKKRKLRRLAA